MTGGAPVIENVTTGVYCFPTPAPEADGTLSWDSTTAVTVQVSAGGETGLGWTYSAGAAAGLVNDKLITVLHARDPLDVAGAWTAMHRACRNLGTKGLAMQAVSAVDVALWDLKARLFGRPLGELFGATRGQVPVYGSGGFTTSNDDQLAEQVDGWRAAGCSGMKIKIGQSWGSDVVRDLHRVRQLRALAGANVELMVDANGGYSPGQARRVGAALDELGVTWFEEPISSDDTSGLGLLRQALRCDIAAGEYVSDVYDAARLAPAVDCLQLDATRCGGYTGWLRCAAVAAAHNLQVSAHCAPALHIPVAAAVPNLRHLEYFIDHVRLEPLLLQGVPEARNGVLHVNTTAPGHGMTLNPAAEEHVVN